MAKLTKKQKVFVDEYLIDFNATQAAIRAGYSERTAYRTGADNLKKPQIQKEIQKRMKDRENRTEITQDKTLKEVAIIAYSNIVDYLKITEVEYVAGYEKNEDGEIDESKPIIKKYKTVEVFNTDEIPREKLAAVQEIKQTKEGISIKLHPKMDAIKLAGQHQGLFKDKLEVTVQKKLEDFFE